MKNKIKIAVIDSGISLHSIDSSIKIKKNYTVTNNFCIVENSNVYDDNGHGTSCTYTIWKICPSCDFVIIKVLDANNYSYPELIINALDFTTEIDVDIINLSLSLYSDQFDHYINETIDKLHNQNKFIITSANNISSKVNRLSLFDNVITVEGAPFITQQQYCYDIEKKYGIASNIPIITPILNNYRLFSGNSKATAVFTGIIGNMLYYNPDKEYLYHQLYTSALLSTWTKSEINKLYDDFRLFITSTIIPQQYSMTHHIIFKSIRKHLTINNENDVINKSLFDLGINKHNCLDVLRSLTELFSQTIPLDTFNYLDLSSIYTLHDALLPYF